jgi:hypothetical protein
LESARARCFWRQGRKRFAGKIGAPPSVRLEERVMTDYLAVLAALSAYGAFFYFLWAMQ